MMYRTLSLLSVIICVYSANAQSPLPLDQQLVLLDQEIAVEQAKVDALQQQLQTDQTQHSDQQQQLASTLFDLQVQQINLAGEHQQLDDQLIQSQQTANDLISQHRQIELLLTQQTQQLDLELRELPGMGELRNQIQKHLKNKPNWTHEQVRILFGLLVQTQDFSARVQVRQVTIPTANGTTQTVNVLSAGHVAFAYQRHDTQTIAIAMAAPEDASGYRWSEDLPTAVTTALQQAIANRPTTANLIDIPMDITQRMRPENLQHEVTIRQRIESGGLIMIPMFALTALALLMIVERFFTLYIRNGKGAANALVIIHATLAGKLDEARQTAATSDTAVARTLHACLLRSNIGSHAMEDAIQEQLLHEMPKLQRFLGGIAILAAVTPLLGLLGTVTGIIRTFGIIQSFGNANPSLMAGGISEALITTAAGLIIAIPLLLAHSILKGRVQTILGDAEKHAATLLNTLTYTQRTITQQANA